MSKPKVNRSFKMRPEPTKPARGRREFSSPWDSADSLEDITMLLSDAIRSCMFPGYSAFTASKLQAEHLHEIILDYDETKTASIALPWSDEHWQLVLNDYESKMQEYRAWQEQHKAELAAYQAELKEYQAKADADRAQREIETRRKEAEALTAELERIQKRLNMLNKLEAVER